MRGVDQHVTRRVLEQRHGVLTVVSSRVGGRISLAVVGYAAWRQVGRRIELLRVAVCPLHWRRGIARKLLAKITAKLVPRRRYACAAWVPSAALRAQQCMKACGFRALATEGERIRFVRFVVTD